MKKHAHLYLVIICFLFAGVLYGQPIDFCGVIGLFQAPTNNPDSIEYDRFGNTYLRSEFVTTPPGSYRSLMCDNDGYFELQFDAVIPQDEETVICQVFTDISSLIIRRENIQEVDDCEDPIAPRPVIIRIREEEDPPGTQDEVLAAASPRYQSMRSDCPNGGSAIRMSNVMRKLNGEPLRTSLDGELFIDITPPLPYYYGSDPLGIDGDEEYD